MDWVLTCAVVFAAWSTARLLGNERQRRVEADHPPAALPPDPAAVATAH